jgi:biotin carboxyl carrier protein
MKKFNHSENNFKSFMLDSIKYRTRLTEKFLSRKKYAPTDPKKVVSFIPGSIKKVNVSPGSKVMPNDKLMVLEAMKMNNYILSPMEGIIKKIHVKVGDSVPKDYILLEFK